MMITFNPALFQGRPHAAAPRFSGQKTEADQKTERQKIEPGSERNNAARAETHPESSGQRPPLLRRQDEFKLTNEQLRPSSSLLNPGLNPDEGASGSESESDNAPDSGLGTPTREDVEDTRNSRFLPRIDWHFQRFQREESPAESLRASSRPDAYDSSSDEYEPEGNDAEGDDDFAPAATRRSLSYTHADWNRDNEQLTRQALQAIQERRRAEASQAASHQNSPSSSQGGSQST